VREIANPDYIYEKPKITLAPSGKSVIMDCPGNLLGAFMPNRSSELVEISKLNGDFKRNYGKLLGAFLYLRSISAACGRPFLWSSLLLALASMVRAWLRKYGLNG